MSPGHWSAGSDTDDDGSGISDDDEGAGDPDGGADAGADVGAGIPFLFGGGYVPPATAVNVAVADSAAVAQLPMCAVPAAQHAPSLLRTHRSSWWRCHRRNLVRR